MSRPPKRPLKLRRIGRWHFLVLANLKFVYFFLLMSDLRIFCACITSDTFGWSFLSISRASGMVGIGTLGPPFPEILFASYLVLVPPPPIVPESPPTACPAWSLHLTCEILLALQSILLSSRIHIS